MVKHIVSWSGGKDSSAMLIRMVEEGMPIDDIVFIHVMATPTIGGEFPEMYEYIHRMERYIDRKITIVQSVLDCTSARSCIKSRLTRFSARTLTASAVKYLP